MVSSLVIGLVIVFAMQVTAVRMVEQSERRSQAVAKLEETRLMAERLVRNVEAVLAAPGDVHRMVAIGTLGRVHRDFRRLRREMSSVRQDGGSAGLHRILADPPHRLAARLAEIDRIVTGVQAGTPPAELRRIATRLDRIAERELQGAFQALRSDHAQATGATLAQVRWIGGGLAALAAAVFLAQWTLVFRPAAREMRRRTRALSRATARVHHNRFFDGLTGVANRSSLIDRTTAAKGAPLGILHIDILGFQSVNSNHGREVGDQVLIHMARTLERLSLGGEVVGRVGGDDFVLATARRSSRAQLETLAGEILRALARPIPFGSSRLRIETVIGISARGSAGEDVSQLLANAEFACNAALGSGATVHFSDEVRQRRTSHQQTIADLLAAVSDGALEPHFQPQIEAATGRITGFEALARWNHPERGVLGPPFFIDALGDPRVGQQITAVMLDRALATLAVWRAKGLEVGYVGLNISAHELRDPRLCDTLMFDLDRHGLEPSDLCVEVLESALIESEDDPILTTVSRLSAAGCRIDLDDFGTGHASLSNLRRIAVDRLKIDRSFVRDLHLKPELLKITAAMIDLARSLGIRTVAEGVETREEWRLLVELGCDELQGYAIGAPMPAAAVPAWISEHAGRRSAGHLIAAA